MIYKLDNGTFVISSHSVWIPGVYASERAAKYAFRFSDEEIIEIKERVGDATPITFEDLQGQRKLRSEK